MHNALLESERLFLRPLSFNELIQINDSKVDSIDIGIESDALSDSIKVAISKKIEKMQKVSENLHYWYTYWLIINRDNGKGTGFIGFKGVPDENGYVEVGYSISSNCRGKGLMTEALSLLINWASKYPDCKGITATRVLKTNIGSNKVLSKSKFVLVESTDEFNNYLLKFKKSHNIEFKFIIGQDKLEEVKRLFVEYAQSLKIDLAFQNFEEEFKTLPGKYGPPDGVLILALVNGEEAGCVALRRISDGISEMKRLYVRDDFKGLGIGKNLVNIIINEARKLGHNYIRLDTLPTMKKAQDLYKKFGFYEIEPYVYNPIEGTRFLELNLKDLND